MEWRLRSIALHAFLDCGWYSLPLTMLLLWPQRNLVFWMSTYACISIWKWLECSGFWTTNNNPETVQGWKCICIHLFHAIIKKVQRPNKIRSNIQSFFFFFFWPHRVACGILAPWPGIEPVFPAVEARSPNHGTASEFPIQSSFTFNGGERLIIPTK